MPLTLPNTGLALLAGILYLLIRAFWAGGWARLARWLSERGPLTLARMAAWAGWEPLGRAARAALGLGCLYGLAAGGVFLAPHVGLLAYDDDLRRQWPSLLLVVGWIGLLWGWTLQRLQRLERVTDATAHDPRWPDLLIDLLDREALLAILRGTLLPLLGSAWGLWWGPPLSGILLWLSIRRQGRTSPDRWAWAGLVWAIDWLSTGLYGAGGSLWVLLLSRGCCYLLALTLWRYAAALRVSESAVND